MLHSLHSKDSWVGSHLREQKSLDIPPVNRECIELCLSRDIKRSDDDARCRG